MPCLSCYTVVMRFVLLLFPGRELKKDPAIRQVYKLVTSILMTDRLRREAVDYEKKLGSIASRGLSLEKLQADLDR